MDPIFTRDRFKTNCQHNKFQVDSRHSTVECGLCGEKLNPMWVIEQFCNKEHRLFMQLDFLRKLAKKAEIKNRCKCEHCEKMTRIQK